MRSAEPRFIECLSSAGGRSEGGGSREIAINAQLRRSLTSSTTGGGLHASGCVVVAHTTRAREDVTRNAGRDVSWGDLDASGSRKARQLEMDTLRGEDYAV